MVDYRGRLSPNATNLTWCTKTSCVGDRVHFEAATTYVLRYEGGDTIIDMGGGNHMILVGVSQSSPGIGWLSQARGMPPWVGATPSAACRRKNRGPW